MWWLAGCVPERPDLPPAPPVERRSPEAVRFEPLAGFVSVPLPLPEWGSAFLNPGNWVNVLETTDRPDGRPRTVTVSVDGATVAVPILEVRDDSVIVMATPAQARRLLGSPGRLFLTLADSTCGWWPPDEACAAALDIHTRLRGQAPFVSRPGGRSGVQEAIDRPPYADPPPSGGPFAVIAEVAPSPWTPGAQLVRVTIRAEPVVQPSARWTFVLDGSASMYARRGQVAAAAEPILAWMNPDDPVSLVRAGVDTALVLRDVRAGTAKPLVDAIADADCTGPTALAAGLRLACARGGTVVLWTDSLGTLDGAEQDAIAAASAGCPLLAAVVAGDRVPWLEAIAETVYLPLPSDGRRLWREHLQRGPTYPDPEVRVVFDPWAVAEAKRIGEGGEDALVRPGATHTQLFEVRLRRPWWRLGTIHVATAGDRPTHQVWTLPARVAPAPSADGWVAATAATLAQVDVPRFRQALPNLFLALRPEFPLEDAVLADELKAALVPTTLPQPSGEE